LGKIGIEKTEAFLLVFSNVPFMDLSTRFSSKQKCLEKEAGGVASLDKIS